MRYLMWDHDGVLVDTEKWYFEATRTALAKIRIELSERTYLDFMAAGRPCWDLARARGAPESEIDELRASRDVLYQEFLKTQPIEIPGVRELLAKLQKDYRMAVVTTARRVDFELVHEHRDLLQYFEFCLTCEDYEECKPAPDPYLAGLRRFGARARDTIAIEDSARGLASARAAGVDCIVVRNAFTRSQDFSAASEVVDSMRELDALLGARLTGGNA